MDFLIVQIIFCTIHIQLHLFMSRDPFLHPTMTLAEYVCFKVHHLEMRHPVDILLLKQSLGFRAQPSHVIHELGFISVILSKKK